MKKIFIVVALIVVVFFLSGCSEYSATYTDKEATIQVANTMANNQPTPTDINYSLERYNLIRRTYWVNGQRERARAIPTPIADIPMGYVILLTDMGGVVGRFEVDGKVTSLNSFLTPDSEYYESSSAYNRWLADIDGSYGENDIGIFFFTPDGRYIEWSGRYLYSDIPFIVENPVIVYEEVGK